MCAQKIREWFDSEFRGWSLMHWTLDGALTFIVGVVLSVFPGVTVIHVILLCVGVLLAAIAATSLWLRQRQGQREARVGDKSEAKKSVKERLSQLAGEVRETKTPEEADAVARRAIRYVAGYFHESVRDELTDIADKIACRTDWNDVLCEIADRLDVMGDIVYASDIRRLPKPGDR